MYIYMDTCNVRAYKVYTENENVSVRWKRRNTLFFDKNTKTKMNRGINSLDS